MNPYYRTQLERERERRNRQAKERVYDLHGKLMLANEYERLCAELYGRYVAVIYEAGWYRAHGRRFREKDMLARMEEMKVQLHEQKKVDIGG